jgi:signal transduction histidine kinase
VEVRIDGEPQAVPGAVDLAAYRILQEALTNVVRHAGASTAVLTIGYGDVLVVQVEDDGRGVGSGSQAADGVGIMGMRERATAIGGTLDVSEAPAGGFRVRAVLPVNGAS